MDDRRIPVTVLTGFLGSGKTTLLRHLLSSPTFAKAAVLINEFGDVGLDHLLVGALDAEPVLLSNGCICCTLRGDVSVALRDLRERRGRGDVPDFDRVVIETTGLAEPAPIVATVLADRVVRHHFRAAGVVTTVGAQAGETALGRHEVMRRQVAAANRIVLTKTDLVEGAAVTGMRDRLRAFNPDAAVVEAVAGVVDATAFTTLDGPGADWTEPSRTSLDGRTRTFTLVLTKPIRWEAFGVWLSLLAHRHGAQILRVKGILNVDGSQTPVVVNAVGPVVHPPEHLPAWPPGSRKSRLVFIVENVDAEQVERSFRILVTGEAADRG